MAAMLGRAARRHSSCCRVVPLGPDCTDFSKSKQTQRQIEKREWRRELRAVPQEREDAVRDGLAAR